MHGQRLSEAKVISPPSLKSARRERPDLCHSGSHNPRIAVRSAESASDAPNSEEPQVADGADRQCRTFGASSRPINQQPPQDQQCQSNGLQQQADHQSLSIHQKRSLEASIITSKRQCLRQSGRNTGQQINIEDDSLRPLPFPGQGSRQATPPASSIAHSSTGSASQPPNHMPQHSMSPNEGMNAFGDLNMNHFSDLFFSDDSDVNIFPDLTFNYLDDLLPG